MKTAFEFAPEARACRALGPWLWYRNFLSEAGLRQAGFPAGQVRRTEAKAPCAARAGSGGVSPLRGGAAVCTDGGVGSRPRRSAALNI